MSNTAGLRLITIQKERESTTFEGQQQQRKKKRQKYGISATAIVRQAALRTAIGVWICGLENTFSVELCNTQSCRH